jgi:beta-glucosidase
MSSYNKVNGSWACDNSYTQNGLLKTELGFQGFVVSDWFGQHSGVGSALAGLDMVMVSITLLLRIPVCLCFGMLQNAPL